MIFLLLRLVLRMVLRMILRMTFIRPPSQRRRRWGESVFVQLKCHSSTRRLVGECTGAKSQYLKSTQAPHRESSIFEETKCGSQAQTSETQFLRTTSKSKISENLKDRESIWKHDILEWDAEALIKTFFSNCWCWCGCPCSNTNVTF